MRDSKRVQRELTQIQKDDDESLSGISVEVCDEKDISHLRGAIAGPMDSPYEGGSFQIDIRLPDGYPFDPPKMRFITKVWHPNISSQNGAICLDILKNQWTPALSLKTALISLQALLSTPEPRDPQDAVVAKQYLNDFPTFLVTARHWTHSFAMRAELVMEEKVAKLVEMGLDKDAVRCALQQFKGDENMALEKLCTS